MNQFPDPSRPRGSVFLVGLVGALACAGGGPGRPEPRMALQPVAECRGTYQTADLRQYLPRARLALKLPTAVSVDLDDRERCLRIGVVDSGMVRIVHLMLRGLAIPPEAVIVEVTEPPIPIGAGSS